MSKNQSLPVNHLHSAGMEVGASCHHVCAGPPGSTVVRCFGTVTEDRYRKQV